MKNILFAGESWHVYSLHTKGFDTFSTSSYQEGGERLIQAFEKAGYEVDYMPSHIAANKFPQTKQELQGYSSVVFSDIGANTLLLSDTVFVRSQTAPNRLDEIAQYVKEGGSFAMMGGYMSFAGIDAKAKYAGTAIEDILPVGVMRTDDREERPQGVHVRATAEHAVLKGIDTVMPHLMGYNKLIEKDPADVLMRTECGDIIAAAKHVGKGRTFAFASDIAPHWAPPEFMSWEHYDTLFGNMARWLCQDI